MRTIRRRLSWMLTGWLVLQLAGIVAPAALSAAEHSAAELCTCPPGDNHGAMCPMHHPQAPDDSENRCRMQATHTGTDAALLALMGGNGLLPEPAGEVVAEAQATPVEIVAAAAPTRSELPDSPPPRS